MSDNDDDDLREIIAICQAMLIVMLVIVLAVALPVVHPEWFH